MECIQNDRIFTIFQEKCNYCMLVSNLGILPVTSQPPNTGLSIGKEDREVQTAHAVVDGLQIQNEMHVIVYS